MHLIVCYLLLYRKQENGCVLLRMMCKNILCNVSYNSSLFIQGFMHYWMANYIVLNSCCIVVSH